MWQGCTDQGHVGPISKVIKKEGGSLGRRKSIRSVGFSIFRNREIHEIFLDMGTLPPIFEEVHMQPPYATTEGRHRTITKCPLLLVVNITFK